MIRLRDPEVVRNVVEALLAGGVTAIEITMTVPGAVGVIETLAGVLPGAVVLGAGTVLDANTIRDVTAAGARFVVAPVCDPELIDVAHECGVASIPGCFTPSEIFAASKRGADIVKVFPAGTLGPSFVRDLLAPLPDLKLLPTGGVTPDSAVEWITAGAVAVGLGSALVDGAAVKAGRFDEITRTARGLIARINAVRASSVTAVRR